MNYRIPAPNFTEFKPKKYICRKAPSALELNGDLDKPFWSGAEWTCDFNDIEGDIRPKPRFRTRAKMLWDNENLYIGAELYGNEIWAHVQNRDDIIFFDNDFEVFIDPDSDTHKYYEFEMNALNTVWDLLLTKPYRDCGCPVNSFDIKGLKTAVKIDGELNNPAADNKKWTLEIVMPFKTLSECNGREKCPKTGDFWRINFSRVQWKVDVVNNEFVKRTDSATGKPLPEDNWIWSPMGIVNMHYPELWPYVFFADGDEDYEIPQDEDLKWQLRRYYYAEHAYFDEYGSFNPSLVVEGTSIKPKIQTTDNLFELSCKSADGKREIILLSDSEIRVKDC